MERFNYRNAQNPHSPTHRSPDLVPRGLTEIVEENYTAARRLGNKFGMENDENEVTSPPGVRFQDHRGPGIRPTHYYQRDNNNRLSDIPAAMYVTEAAYESAESSISSPLSSGKTPQFHEPEFANYGYNDDDDENSVVSHNTTKEEHRTYARSALSSVNDNGDGGGIWDDAQLLLDSYRTKKEDTFKEIESYIRKLRTLEEEYEREKDSFHNSLTSKYRGLRQQLVRKHNSLEKARTEFIASANVGQGNIIPLQKAMAEAHHQLKDQAMFPNDRVKLNVGGEEHTTSLATLRKEPSSLLAMMFSGRHQLIPDEGAYFIDRDPTHFRHILNYLRDSPNPPPGIQDPLIRQELLQEAEYYKIDSLVQHLQQQQ